MSVSSQETQFPYTGNGVTVTFPYNCQVQKAGDLDVYLAGVLVTSGYTINGVGSLSGGSVTFTTAPAAGVSVLLERVVELERTTDYQQNGDFLARVVNPDFDRIWMALQQIAFNVTRALRFPRSDSNPVTELPPAAERANRLLGFDSQGNPSMAAPVSGSATDLALALASASGSSQVGDGAGTVQDALDGARALTYYGTGQAALLALLNYAKNTGKPICLNRDVTLTSDLIVNMAGARLNFDFAGYAVYTDSFRLGIQNPGTDSFINKPNMRVITAPWVITRWGPDGNWLPEDQILGTLTQTLAPGYYQPSVNDGSVYSALTPEQKNQNISALLYVYGANGLVVQSPRGLYCLYEFDMCSRTEVVDPQILCGGKGTYGTILFKDLETVGYGTGNYVTGGFVHYGSFSGVCFMRNRMGGASQLSLYRTGESGVKFYQNEVGGRSARCYNMKMLDIDSHQTVYDGHDYNSDFGSPAERVDDYTLAQFPWNQLPTGHVISNVRAVDCYGVGVWGDGQFNQYSTLHAERCFKDGIYLRTTNSEIDDPFVFDCNRAGGHHQITCEGEGTRINSAKTHTTSIITDGFAIYCTGSTTVTNDERCTGTRIDKQINRANRSSNNLTMGTRDITQSNVRLFGKPREDLLMNPCGELRFVLTGATPGSEEGLVGVFAYTGGGVASRGLLAMPGEGGHAQMGAQGSFNGGLLNTGYVAFYESSGTLRMAYKKLDGSVITGGFTA